MSLWGLNWFDVVLLVVLVSMFLYIFIRSFFIGPLAAIGEVFLSPFSAVADLLIGLDELGLNNAAFSKMNEYF